jgi:hypothetical protein
MLYINVTQHITYAYLTITFAVSLPAEPLPAAIRPLHLSQSGGSYASCRCRAVDDIIILVIIGSVIHVGM